MSVNSDCRSLRNKTTKRTQTILQSRFDDVWHRALLVVQSSLASPEAVTWHILGIAFRWNVCSGGWCAWVMVSKQSGFHRQDYRFCSGSLFCFFEDPIVTGCSSGYTKPFNLAFVGYRDSPAYRVTFTDCGRCR